MIIDRVMKRGARPIVFAAWPQKVSDLMNRCWDGNVLHRPSFTDIRLTLSSELVERGTSAAGAPFASMDPGN